MKKMMCSFLFAVLALSLSAAVSAQNSTTGNLNDTLGNGKVSLTVRDVGQVTSFENLSLDENYEKIADELSSLKEAMAKGEVKCIFVDATLKNVSGKPVTLGYRTKKMGEGDFRLASSGGVVQDSGNRNEFYEQFTVMGVIVSGRRVMELAGGLMPESMVVQPGQEISGKILFVVPADFEPASLSTVNGNNFGSAFTVNFNR